MTQVSQHTEQLVRDAVLAGDVAAWEIWYNAYFDKLAAYARWRTAGHMALADEVVQETWLLAIRKLASFDPTRGAFEAWLIGIAANVARNLVRSHQRERHRQACLAQTQRETASTPPPESQEGVALALAELPEHYEQALRMKYLEGRCVDAIAGELRQSPKAVESLLTRARQAFREAYQKVNHE